MEAGDWEVIKIRNKRRKKRNLTRALNEDDGQWIKHTEYHWKRYVGPDKKPLDYWPTSGKWKWRGKIRKGVAEMKKVIDAFA